MKKLILALLFLTSCYEQAEVLRLKQVRQAHSKTFMEKMGLHESDVHCKDVSIYEELPCSAVMDKKPVQFNCDKEGCWWVFEKTNK